MIVFIVTTILISLFFEFLTSFWILLEQIDFNDNLFIYIYLFLFILNFYFIKNIAEFNFNLDLLYKYYLLFFKTPNFLLNSVIIGFKKFFTYLVFFRNKHYFDFIRIFYKKNLCKYFIIWRPLFKKFSYFGYYRSNRSKWIK